MLIETKTMGKVEVSDEQLIKLPAGLFGFTDYHGFALIDCHVKPLIWMQSLEDKDLAFLLLDPFIVCPDYEADIDDSELSKLGIADPADVLLMAIITVPNDGSHITANLRGPLVINKKSHEGMQVILEDKKWPIKFDVTEAMDAGEGK
ncbi:MAG: flagellar assembly protein FliW [Treponema sp.]|nr:flagellar assembly protein FliW [Treponema sp.]MBQ7166565.1 flagellar assembly protein FliW [Treponema sp.]